MSRLSSKKQKKIRWNGEGVRALRQHMGLTQENMATELGIRQQTVSEWERNIYQPRGPSATLLTLVAERAGFCYTTGSEIASQDSHVLPS